jgi:hypothetical protein
MPEQPQIGRLKTSFEVIFSAAGLQTLSRGRVDRAHLCLLRPRRFFGAEANIGIKCENRPAAHLMTLASRGV